MKFKFLVLPLLGGLLSFGCAHRAAHISAPDASRMEKSHAALGAGIAQAKAAAHQVGALLDKAQASHAVEMAQLSETAPKTQSLLKQATPELRPLVESLAGDLDTLRGDQEAHEQDMRAAKEAQDAHGTQLDDLAGKVDAAAKDRADYEAEAARLADRANAAESGWAADSKALAWYRLHWWGAWLVAAAGVALCGLLAFLKFTARLAAGAVAVAK